MKSKKVCHHPTPQFICQDNYAIVYWCNKCGSLRIDLAKRDKMGVNVIRLKGMWEKPENVVK